MAAADPTTLERMGRYRSARKKRPRPPLKLQPPLTPMIDVTFQLLLFFLLTMQFHKAEGQLPADLPKLGSAVAAAVTPLEPVWIYLHPSDEDPEQVRIDIRQYHLSMHTWDQLHTQLVDLRTQLGSEEVPVIIEPGAGVSWGAALNAFNEVRRARFTDIAFARRSGGT